MASKNAQNTKTQQDLIAKQKAKDAVAAKKAEHAAELDKPATADEQEAAQAENETGATGNSDGATADEKTGQTAEGVSEEQASELAKTAAQGLKDGGSLTDEQVQSLAGKTLSEIAEDKRDEKTVEQENVKLREDITELEARVGQLEEALAKVGVTVKKDSTHVGSIDDLGKIEDLKA